MSRDSHGVENSLRDSRGNVAVFDFHGASASTSEYRPLLSHAKLGYMLIYNGNAKWNISFG